MGGIQTLIDTLLVANRGEIAVRVLRTAHALGLRTVAVYSDADAGAPHVALADEAVRIGPPPAAESYLNVDAILEAARRTGADAIHPGYGFLAENADFVAAVEGAGLVFVGPRAETVRAMGDKAAARELMAARGVPVVPGYSGADQSVERFAAAAEEIGYPVLVKASAGGGGKGMSIVESADALPAALESAKRLAAKAFGDDRVLLERYVTSPRHVEVQILGDDHGRVVHCFERECSVQRRFQKIIEETPSPALDDETRARLCAAGVTAGEALGYRNAGTVEFILAPDGAFYFLEVNTRLQVEHPVTEMTCGLDLVRWQLLVAMGESAPEQADIQPVGHSIECRLYAEDPARGFRPATGTLVEWAAPKGDGVRVDSGVGEGTEVGIEYDPLLAKLVVWGETRREALTRMAGALRRFGAQGVTTNRAFLYDVVRHDRFVAGALSTHFVEEELAGWVTPEPDDGLLVAAAVFDAERDRPRLLPGLRPGWRNSPYRPAEARYLVAGEERVVRWEAVRGGYRVSGRSVRVVPGDAGLVLEIDGHRRRFVVVADGARRFVREGVCDAVLEVVPRFPEVGAGEDVHGCVAPMPGRVARVLVTTGQAVEKGQAVIIVEAMKMEQTLTAPEAGTVAAVPFGVGDVVDAGVLLVEIDPSES